MYAEYGRPKSILTIQRASTAQNPRLPHIPPHTSPGPLAHSLQQPDLSATVPYLHSEELKSAGQDCLSQGTKQLDWISEVGEGNIVNGMELLGRYCSCVVLIGTS